MQGTSITPQPERKLAPVKQQLEPEKTSFQLNDNFEPSSGGNMVVGYLLTLTSILLTVLTFPLSLLFVIKVVQQYEKAVIFRLGEIKNKKGAGPGLFTYLPCLDEMRIVDMRTISFDVAPQEILTKDSVTVTVDAVVYYRIRDAIMSVCNVDDVQKATKLLAQTTLRNMLGTRTLAGILSEREIIASGIQNTLDEATDPWGVVVERVEVKDVKLPLSLQRAMAAEAEADRDARAKVVAAQGELKASQALKDAADIITESPAALQLRYLQTLCTVAAEKNSTIIFPIPVDIMKSFMKKEA